MGTQLRDRLHRCRGGAGRERNGERVGSALAPGHDRPREVRRRARPLAKRRLLLVNQPRHSLEQRDRGARAHFPRTGRVHAYFEAQVDGARGGDHMAASRREQKVRVALAQLLALQVVARARHAPPLAQVPLRRRRHAGRQARRVTDRDHEQIGSARVESAHLWLLHQYAEEEHAALAARAVRWRVAHVLQRARQSGCPAISGGANTKSVRFASCSLARCARARRRPPPAALPRLSCRRILTGASIAPTRAVSAAKARAVAVWAAAAALHVAELA